MATSLRQRSNSAQLPPPDREPGTPGAGEPERETGGRAVPLPGRLLGGAVAAGCFLLLGLWGFHQAHYGCSLSDEGLYVAAPIRYALGDVPFRDEWMHTLTMFDLLVRPVMSAVPEIGLLHMRLIGLGIDLACLLAAVLFLRRYAPAWLLATGCLAVCFLGYGIFTPNYNGLGRSLLCWALVLWLVACRREQRGPWTWLIAVLGGIALFLAVLAYTPNLLLVGVPLALLALSCLRKLPLANARRATLGLLAALAGAAACFAAVLAASGILDDYLRAFRWHFSAATAGLGEIPKAYSFADRLQDTATHLGDVALYSLAVAGGLWVAWGFLPRRFSRGALPGILPAIGLLVWFALVIGRPTAVPELWAQQWFHFWPIVLAFGILAWCFTYRITRFRDPQPGTSEREWLFVRNALGAGALLYALIQAFFSTNRFRNVIFGTPLLLLVALAELGWLMLRARAAPRQQAARAGSMLALASAASILAGLTSMRSAEPYQEPPAAQLTAVFNHRYLRGIRSTPQRVAGLEATLAYLEPRLRRGDFFHTQDESPMLYFLLRVRPALPRTWAPMRQGFPQQERQRMLDHMLDNGRVPDYYVEYRYPDEPVESDPIHRFFRDHYHPVASFGEFGVWQRNGLDEAREQPALSACREDSLPVPLAGVD